MTSKRPWLKKVKKIQTKHELTADSFSDPGTLYLFDNVDSNGNISLYYLPLLTSLPGDSALAGNGGQDSRPLLILGNGTVDDALGTMKLADGGHYALINIELTSRTYISDQVVHHTLLQADSPDSLELSGVRFSPYFHPDTDGSTETFLEVTNKGDSKKVELTINNSTFQFPYWTDPTNYLALSAMSLVNSGQEGQINLSFSNNSVTVSDAMALMMFLKQTTLTFLETSGSINISKDSICNSIIDDHSQPVSESVRPDLFSSKPLSQLALKPQVIGFKNDFGWGRPTGSNDTSIMSWNKWKDEAGVNIECNGPSDSRLAGTVIAGVLLVTGTVLMAITGFIIYRQKCSEAGVASHLYY